MKDLGISIVSPGSMGIPLAKSLQNAGCRLNFIYSRNKEKIKIHFGESVQYTNRIEDLTQENNLIFIALPDKLLLNNEMLLPLQSKKLIYLSGATKLQELNYLSNEIGVFYPFQSFTVNALPDFKNVPICVEATNEQLSKQLIELGNKISDICQIMNYEQRLYLHLLGVIGNNFTNFLFQQVEQIANKKNIPKQVVLPLLQQTISSFSTNSSSASQTGPAKRGDFETIKKHLELLKDEKDLKALYFFMTNQILNKYHGKHI